MAMLYKSCGLCQQRLSTRQAVVGRDSAAGRVQSPVLVQQQWQQQQLQHSRRQLLQLPLVGVIFYAGRASAQSAVNEELERQMPGLPTAAPAQELPKAYIRTMHRLVKALNDSIEAEASGAKEMEVRRKADPAKEMVREFVSKWQDDAAVVGDVAHDEMQSALSQLGRFYQKNGSRSRLDDATRQSVLSHLAAVEASLPEEPKSLLGL
eukprot:GHRR01005602.1.p1 GENE.GHRR01005602.1~~GHRR01005602.1.p1  ORF type:complete len:208 (+),score=88.86 GHRR01005602.1:136-759(+)